MHATPFMKRIYKVQPFLRDIREIMNHAEDVREASRARRVSKAFREKIMLAVTYVNGCRWCNYGHTRAALREGVSEDELRHLMEGEFALLPEGEVVALAFAQHYAETAGHPEPAALQRLGETYGHETARDVLAYIRMITMGNLLGNTFDALLSRIRGNPAPGSTMLSEFGVLCLAVLVTPIAFLSAAISLLKRPLAQRH
jgi:AhpD family alkylhydroperoxidase